MYRITAMLLLCLLAMSLAACGGAATPTAQNEGTTPLGESSPIAAPTLPPATDAAATSAPEATATSLPIVPMQTALATLLSGTTIPEVTPTGSEPGDVRGTPEPLPTTVYVDDSLGLAVPLTDNLLLNSEYVVPSSYGMPVQLVDGVYEDHSDPNALRTVRILPEFIAYGDIDSDGLEEAVVPFSTNTIGTTGVFIDLIVVSGKSGSVQQFAATSLGDRVLIKAITVEPGRILVTMVTHGANDPSCCPTLEVTVPYTFVNGALSKGEPIESGTSQ